MKKNDIVTVKIEDMSENGEGIGKLNGYALFIKDTVIGDEAQVRLTKLKKNYGYARLLQVIIPSPMRVAPRCPVAAPCGGCQLQAMSYEGQLKFKEKKVRSLMERIGKLENPPILPVIGMEEPWHYRNKAQFPVSQDENGRIRMGFYAGRTHSIVETDHCFLGDPMNEKVLAGLKEYMEEAKVTAYDELVHRGLVRHILIRKGFFTGQVMVCLVINGKSLPKRELFVDKMKKIEGMTSISYNINQEKTNVILGNQVINLYGPGYITDRIGKLEYQIAPQSFFQVNPVQTKKLYDTALDFAGLTGEETVWDLYCGTGTISLFLAERAKKVYGVEIVEAAVADARSNARRNGIDNAEFFVGKAEEILPEKYRTEQIKADVIVVDPPRKGCDPQLLDTIVKMEPKRVVYVSCDPATLARDLKYMTEKGYAVEKIQPVDMFPQTENVETVCALSRIK